MAKEIIIAAAFFLALSGVYVSFVICQKNAAAKIARVEHIMECANETE